MNRYRIQMKLFFNDKEVLRERTDIHDNDFDAFSEMGKKIIDILQKRLPEDEQEVNDDTR